MKQKENDNFKIFYTLKIGIKSLQGVILRGKKLQWNKYIKPMKICDIGQNITQKLNSKIQNFEVKILIWKKDDINLFCCKKL